jgi:hypothetical protein
MVRTACMYLFVFHCVTKTVVPLCIQIQLLAYFFSLDDIQTLIKSDGYLLLMLTTRSAPIYSVNVYNASAAYS